MNPYVADNADGTAFHNFIKKRLLSEKAFEEIIKYKIELQNKISLILDKYSKNNSIGFKNTLVFFNMEDYKKIPPKTLTDAYLALYATESKSNVIIKIFINPTFTKLNSEICLNLSNFKEGNPSLINMSIIQLTFKSLNSVFENNKNIDLDIKSKALNNKILTGDSVFYTLCTKDEHFREFDNICKLLQENNNFIRKI